MKQKGKGIQDNIYAQFYDQEEAKSSFQEPHAFQLHSVIFLLRML